MGMAIGDLNDDTIPEIVIMGSNCNPSVETTYVNVVEPDGTWFPNFPKIYIGSYHQPVLGDINGDGFLEIIFVGSVGYGNPDGCIYAIDYEGNILPNFPFIAPNDWFASSVSLGNLDEDSFPEIIASTAGQQWHPTLWAVDGNEGLLNGFPVEIPVGDEGSVMCPPSITDLNNDERGEIIVTSEGGYQINIQNYTILEVLTFITCFSAYGSTLPGYPLICPVGTPNSPLISDIEGDGFLDLTITCLSSIYSFTTSHLHFDMHWPLPYHDIHNTSNYHYVPPEISVSELTKYRHLLKFSSPSIVKNEFKFKLSLPDGFKNKKLKILFYSVDGRKLKEFSTGKSYRTYQKTVNISNFKRGIYFYILKFQDIEILKGKFIKI